MAPCLKRLFRLETEAGRLKIQDQTLTRPVERSPASRTRPKSRSLSTTMAWLRSSSATTTRTSPASSAGSASPANANGNQIVIRGPREASEPGAARLRAALRPRQARPARQRRRRRGRDRGDLLPGHSVPSEFESGGDAFGQIKTRKRGVVRARNAAQDCYIAALRSHELVFAEGPAGTGKTWLAVGHAVALLEQGVVERLILSRPRSRPASDWASCRRHARQGRSLPAADLRRALRFMDAAWSSAASRPG